MVETEPEGLVSVVPVVWLAVSFFAQEARASRACGAWVTASISVASGDCVTARRPFHRFV